MKEGASVSLAFAGSALAHKRGLRAIIHPGGHARKL